MREVVSCTLTVIVTLDTDGYKVEDRKTLCQLLGKLVLPSTADQTLLNTLYILITNLLEVRPYSFPLSTSSTHLPHLQLCPFEDTNTTTLFTRFKSRFEKHFASSLGSYSEKECFEDESDTYDEIFAFLGISKPRDRKFEGVVSNEDESGGKGRRERSKSRGVSVAPSEVESEAGPSKPSRSKQNG